MNFQGKGVVITGGASGIGLATAKKFAAQGANIVLTDIEEGALAIAQAEIDALGSGKVVTYVCNVADHDAVLKLADFSFDALGKVHIVFNNAGIALHGPIAEMTHDDWRWTIDVDLWGPIHGVEAFLQRIIDQGEGGHMLFTSSFAGLTANVGLGPYCVAKYGVVALAEVLRKETREHNIGASVLCPMRVGTNIRNSDRNRGDEYGGSKEETLVPDQSEDNRDLAGRVVDVDDVAAMVVQAVVDNDLYILPHEESRRYVQNRFNRIEAAFEKQFG